MDSSENSEYLRDKYSKLILKSTRSPKSAKTISIETKIPLGIVYRRLEILSKRRFLQISGTIENGTRLKLYHNKPKRYHVLNPRISHLLDIIRKNPGLSFRGIQKLSGYPFGTLSNSLSNLEKDSKIIIKRSKRRSCYFSLDVPSDEHVPLINLRKETSRSIILYLAKNQKASFAELRKHANKSPSTVSLTLTNLIECSIVRRVSGLRPYFELQDASLIENILIRIEPKTIDSIKDRFADTFSYL